MTINFALIKKWAVKHAPEILTGCAVAGTIVTTGLAIKATKDTIETLEDDVHLTEQPFGDKVKATWKHWIPCTLAGAATITSIVCANSLHMKKEAGLAAAAALWQGKYLDLAKSVKENLPEKKQEDVLGSARQEALDRAKLPKGIETTLKPGEILVFEPMSEQFFISTPQQIIWAELQANKIMARQEGFTLNEFLRLFPKAHQYRYGSDIGWFKGTDSWEYAWDLYGQAWIDLDLKRATVQGRECFYLDYGVPPQTEGADLAGKLRYWGQGDSPKSIPNEDTLKSRAEGMLDALLCSR